MNNLRPALNVRRVEPGTANPAQLQLKPCVCRFTGSYFRRTISELQIKKTYRRLFMLNGSTLLPSRGDLLERRLFKSQKNLKTVQMSDETFGEYPR